MSAKYPGGFITKNYVAPTPAAAPGIWTLDQQLQAQKSGTWPFGGPFNYIEDVFSTYLYTGNGATQTITNGIDLAGKGGLVWGRRRSACSNILIDTNRGTTKLLKSESSAAQSTETQISSFNSSGFSLNTGAELNTADAAIVSWTFRKQPKFFDVVTYTGNGTSQNIAHSLGSVPGCIIVKNISNTLEWFVYHSSTGNTQYSVLNTTAIPVTSSTAWNNTTPTASVFTVGNSSSVNENGVTMVAYIFASNAGGFGATGTDNVVSCGGFTADGAGAATVNLGYEPQWLLVKRTSSATDWQLYDNMRGFTVDNVGQLALRPNTATAESAAYPYAVNATGFSLTGVGAGNTFVYIAIRKGPMKVPTDGTKVFTSIAQTPQSPGTVRTVGFSADLMIGTYRDNESSRLVNTRLIGYANNSGASQNTLGLKTESTAAETSEYPLFYNVWNTTAKDGDYIFYSNGINWMFNRAPSFFDVVCYTGNSSSLTVPHNLGVAPELVIFKNRGLADDWYVASKITSTNITRAYLNYTIAGGINTNAAGGCFTAQPTASSMFLGSNYTSNASGYSMVAYLFATCPEVSKVGSYTGTGASQVINCGFTAGARFVLIKRTDSTGGWYTYDTARGMVTGTDPYLLLNSTAAEVNADYVFTSSTGFTIQAAAPADINASGGSYIFLAIA